MEKSQAEICREHLREVERIDTLTKETEGLRHSMEKLSDYMPEIKGMLERVVHLQEKNKEIYVKVEEVQRELFQVKLKQTEHDEYIKSQKESRGEFRRFLYAIAGGLVIATVTQVAALLWVISKLD
jgi:peptidoglycan hydrolase CwlO-like protein